MTTENGFIIMADYFCHSLCGLGLWQIRESRSNENHLYPHHFLATKEEENFVVTKQRMKFSFTDQSQG